MKRNELQGRIDEFGRKTNKEFSFYELVEHLRADGVGVNEDTLYEIAVSSEVLIEVDSLNEIFASRQNFFDGAQFRFTPLADEVAGGYIVPGHRLMPFLSRAVFPADAKLVLPGGSIAPTRRISLPLKQVLPFLHFFGSDGSAEYLIMESDDNVESLLPPFEGAVELTVFDLQAYFKSIGFSSGDSLMLIVDDWNEGVFVLQAVPAQKRMDMTVSRNWINSVAESMENAMNELGASRGDCYEQFALTVRNAQESSGCVSVTDHPPMSFVDWFNQQEGLVVKSVGDRSLFWEINSDPMRDVMLEAMENPPLPDSELDAFFQTLGLSLCEAEAEAYMLDALFHEEERADAVLARILEGRTLHFSTPEEQRRFHDLWQEKWGEVQKTYWREDDALASLRSRFLACNDRCLAVLRKIDAAGIGAEVLNDPAFMDLNKFSSIILEALILFNDLDNKESPPFPDDALDNMMVMIDELSDRLVGRAGEKKTLVQSLYQLKVTLKGSKPPIWRRIVVPAHMELEGLHYTIQAAMGWGDYHLHQFLAGRMSYQPGYDEDSFPGCEFENYDGVLVSHLLRQERDKIVYEYDFGDSWEHVVQLEKILKPENGKTIPVCIKGKRACPPEDCGGIWGYTAILDEDDSFLEKEVVQSYRKEIGDPEAFDLNAANQRIQKWFS